MTVVAELFAAALSVPQLRGAACRNKSALFDRTVRGSGPLGEILAARRQALAVCRGCSVLEACRGYVDGLEPGLRPPGVVAGRVNGWRDEPAAATIAPVNSGDNQLGEVLRSLRVQRGWRQRDVAMLIGTGQNRIGDWEAGQHVPTLPLLAKLAGVYETTVAQILTGIM